MLIIQKYGGTSVGSLERIAVVAGHIANCFKSGQHIGVVVSAMGHQTDELIDMALRLNQRPPKRELDMLLTAGERISMALLSIALQKLEIDAVSFTGSQTGILTDDTHGNARIQKILGDRIKQAITRNQVFIVAGFQGMSAEKKEITTLGRGGSDLTAVALAHILGADACEIYSDVDGVLSADPRLVKKAKTLNYISWDSMTELSNYGAAILHHRAANLAKKFKVPLKILSSFDFSKPGTTVGRTTVMERSTVYSISHKPDLVFLELKVSGNLNVEKEFAQAMAELIRQGESPLINHHIKKDKEWYISQIIAKQHVNHYLELLQQYVSSLEVLQKKEHIACITVIGDGFWQDGDILSKSLSCLTGEPFLFESKNSAINFCVEQSKLEQCLNLLHQSLIENPSLFRS